MPTSKVSGTPPPPPLGGPLGFRYPPGAGPSGSSEGGGARAWLSSASAAAAAAGDPITCAGRPPRPAPRDAPSSRSRSQLQGGDGSPFAVVSRAHGIGDIWALGSRTDPAEPAKGHGSPGGAHPRAADIPPPAAETASGHGPLAAINNLWPAATPRGLASPWPGAWKYLFHEEAEELGVVGRVTAARASGAAVRDTLSLPTVVSEKQLFAGCPWASRLLALFIILWALLPSSCACYEK